MLKARLLYWAILPPFLFIVSLSAMPQGDLGAAPSATVLLKTLLSRDISDADWRTAEKQFEQLSPKEALPALFPEIAKGMPSGGIYNCFDPVRDRQIAGWGEFCVVNWLWCKQLACLQKRAEVSKVLLELWSQPISFDGQMALLRGLCGNPEAESRMVTLLRDGTADASLRTEAAVCLLVQDDIKYHREVVALAEDTSLLDQPGWFGTVFSPRQRLSDTLTSRRFRGLLEPDSAVVRLGFTLLTTEADKQNVSKTKGTVSSYGAFLIADHLNTYLGAAFEPDRKLSRYAGVDHNETFWHDTVADALDWWSKHRDQYNPESSSPTILVESAKLSNHGELNEKVKTLEQSRCLEGHRYFDVPVTFGDFVGGKVKIIRVRSLLTTTPHRSPAKVKDLQETLMRVWQGKFQSAACSIPWAEGTLWAVESVLEFEDGTRGMLITDGVHLAVQGHDSKVWFLRLLPAAQ